MFLFSCINTPANIIIFLSSAGMAICISLLGGLLCTQKTKYLIIWAVLGLLIYIGFLWLHMGDSVLGSEKIKQWFLSR